VACRDGDTLIDLRCSSGRALDRERRCPRTTCGREPAAQSAVQQQARYGRSERRAILRRRQESGGSVFHYLRNSAGTRSGDRFPHPECVDEDGPHPFLSRAERNNVGRREKSVGVTPIAGEVDVRAEARLRNGSLDDRAQWSIADDKSVSIGDSVHDSLHRPHKCQRILVSDERGHHDHQRRIVGNSKQTQRTTISSWNRSRKIDPARNYLDLLRVDTARDERISDRLGYRDDRRGPTILEL